MDCGDGCWARFRSCSHHLGVVGSAALIEEPLDLTMAQGQLESIQKMFSAEMKSFSSVPLDSPAQLDVTLARFTAMLQKLVDD